MSKSIEVKTCSCATHVLKGAYNGSSGYNLWSAEKKILRSWSRELILIDLNIAIPEGHYGRIVRRFGIAKKYGIMVHNGAIDSDCH